MQQAIYPESCEPKVLRDNIIQPIGVSIAMKKTKVRDDEVDRDILGLIHRI